MEIADSNFRVQQWAVVVEVGVGIEIRIKMADH